MIASLLARQAILRRSEKEALSPDEGRRRWSLLPWRMGAKGLCKRRTGEWGMRFNPHAYWEERLSSHLSDLKGVGQIGRIPLLNHYYYKAKTRAVNRALASETGLSRIR